MDITNLKKKRQRPVWEKITEIRYLKGFSYMLNSFNSFCKDKVLTFIITMTNAYGISIHYLNGKDYLCFPVLDHPCLLFFINLHSTM